MPKFRVPGPPRVVQAAVEEENAVQDVEVSFHIFLDQNRTGDVTQLVAIEGDQDWAWGAQGAGGQGAVLLVNSDDDDRSRTRDCDDATVNSDADKSELAPLHVRFRGVDVVPATWQAWLKVDQRDRIRIFASDAGDAREIIGPGTGDEVELSSLQKQTCQGAGELKLRMEALTYAGPGFEDGLVKISFKVKGTGGVEKTDSAKVRVAPWMIAHHGVRATHVYVTETDDNDAFRTALDGHVRASGGCALRPLKPATEATPSGAEELLDVGKCYGMKALLAQRDNYRTILRAAIIKVQVDFNYDRTKMTMAQVAAACRRDVNTDTAMTEEELWLYDGGTGESNRSFLRRNWSLDRGKIKVPGFWKVTDVSPDALEKVAESFLENPPASLQELFQWDHAGQTNAERLLVPGRQMALPPSQDRWMQDCMEIGYTSLPGKKIDDVMRATRNRPLRNIAPSLLAQDFGYHKPGTPRRSTTFDANGNLEVTPPCTSQAGKTYTWGRIYYGSGRVREKFDPDVELFLKKQVVQEPIDLDSKWLSVGHVDEMVSWVRAPINTERVGFPYRLLVAAPALALDILSRNRRTTARERGILWRYADVSNLRDRGTRLSLGGRGVGCLSINAFFDAGLGSHRDFRDWQAEAQRHLDGVVNTLKTQTGVRDAEIIKVPILYEKNDRGFFDAITAAMVNMLVINDHCIIPKPFGPIVGGVDLFQDEVSTKLTALGLSLHWIDDWDEYHVNLGEVHCGTNTLRAPPAASWWEFEP